MPFSSLKGYRHFSSGNKKNSAIDVSFWWCFLEACNQQIFWLCKGRKRWYYPAEYACMRPQITPTQYLVCLLVDLLRSYFVPTVVDQLSNSWQPSLLPAGDLAATVLLARRSIRRSISHCCLSGTVLVHCMLAFARQHWHGFLPLNSPRSWTIYMSRGAYDLTEEMCHLSVICESGSEYVYMGMYGCCILSPGSTTGKGNRLLVKGPVWSLKKWKGEKLYLGPIWSLKKWEWGRKIRM